MRIDEETYNPSHIIVPIAATGLTVSEDNPIFTDSRRFYLLDTS